MRFTWDENKRRSNLRKHGLDFKSASAIFDSDMVTFEDTRFHYTERRFITLGWLGNTAIHLVYAETAYETRLISFRRATRRETAILEDQGRY